MLLLSNQLIKVKTYAKVIVPFHSVVSSGTFQSRPFPVLVVYKSAVGSSQKNSFA